VRCSFANVYSYLSIRQKRCLSATWLNAAFGKNFFTTTMLAPAATLVVWTFLDVARSGKATAVGAATASVVGLVAITPAADPGRRDPRGTLLQRHHQLCAAEGHWPRYCRSGPRRLKKRKG
jgi:hypothetical protein